MRFEYGLPLGGVTGENRYVLQQPGRKVHGF
jgi:hypothetical protein